MALNDFGNHFAGKFDLNLFFGIVPRLFPLYNEYHCITQFCHFISYFVYHFVFLSSKYRCHPDPSILENKLVFFFNKYKINKQTNKRRQGIKNVINCKIFTS